MRLHSRIRGRGGEGERERGGGGERASDRASEREKLATADADAKGYNLKRADTASLAYADARDAKPVRGRCEACARATPEIILSNSMTVVPP